MKISNWDTWQTFRKDRGTPPWIKVYRNLFSNPEWIGLSDSEKGQLVSMWILAADKDGSIPDNPLTVQKMCMLEDKPNLEKFESLGFINNVQSDNEIEPSSSEDLSEEGKVYFIKLQNSVKIGFSKNPWARLAQLKCGMPYEPELLGHVVATKEQEKELHVLFAPIRMSGEWFNLTPDLKGFISKSIADGKLPSNYRLPVVGLPDAPEKRRVEKIREDKSKKEWVPPNGLNMEAWSEFEQHRKEIKKPMSDLARTKASNLICSLSHADQQATIDKSITSKWPGLFPEKGNQNGQYQQPNQQISTVERSLRETAAYAERCEQEVRDLEAQINNEQTLGLINN